MQIIGDRNVRVVPDVAVSGNGGGGGLGDALLRRMVQTQAGKSNEKQPSQPPAPSLTKTMTAKLSLNRYPLPITHY